MTTIRIYGWSGHIADQLENYIINIQPLDEEVHKWWWWSIFFWGLGCTIGKHICGLQDIHGFQLESKPMSHYETSVRQSHWPGLILLYILA